MRRLYRNLLLLYVIVLSLSCFAQSKPEFNVVSFSIDPFSTIAQDKQYEKIDGNGDRYAIIKVKAAQGEGNLEGFTFNFGSLNSMVESHDDELWVYVQRNAKTVTIKRPGYKSIEKYDLNTTIQPGKTYDMTLTMSRIHKEVVHDITKQVLQFIVTPSDENAFVKVKSVNTDSDYLPWGSVDETGSIDKLLEFGTYDYIISAENYVTSSGRIVLSDSKKTYIEKVTLKPDFGFLTIDDTHGISGAQAFVDDNMIGTVPYKDFNRRWSCGQHTLTITNGDLYKPYKTTFTIEQGDTTRLAPMLESDFAETTITVDADAEIFVDGISKGRRVWSGPLKAGKYVVTSKQKNHRESSTTITVKADKAETFTIPAPTPVTGSVYVRSTPSGASILIDGEMKGVTPLMVQDVLIGLHKATLSLVNHKEENIEFTITEGNMENVDVRLSDITHMTINTTPSGSKLFINGEAMGMTPFTQEMASGDYDIEVRHAKYRTFKEKVHLDSSNPERMINLKRQYQQPNSFYVQPYLQIGGLMSVGGAIGGYITNVNIEANYAAGLNNSEMIYWNSTADKKPCGYSYKASCMGGRLGYAFILGARMRLTPQVGVGIVSIQSSETYNEDPAFDASKTFAVSTTIGSKFECALMNCLGVFVAPEFCFIVQKGDYFETISEISGKVKSFASGINVRIGLSLFF